MKSDHITKLENNNIICFRYSTTSKFNLDYYINNINLNEYYIYKTTRHQRQVSIQDFLEFKYVSYILFSKSQFNDYDIDYLVDNYSLAFIGVNFAFILNNYKTLNIKKIKPING